MLRSSTSLSLYYLETCSEISLALGAYLSAYPRICDYCHFYLSFRFLLGSGFVIWAVAPNYSTLRLFSLWEVSMLRRHTLFTLFFLSYLLSLISLFFILSYLLYHLVTWLPYLRIGSCGMMSQEHWFPSRVQGSIAFQDIPWASISFHAMSFLCTCLDTSLWYI